MFERKLISYFWHFGKVNGTLSLATIAIVSTLWWFSGYGLAFGFTTTFVFYVFLTPMVIIFIVSVIMMVASREYDKKLARLKAIGQRLDPVGSTFLGGNISIFRYEGAAFYTFRIECVLQNSAGKEFSVKSRRFTTCKGWFVTVATPATVNYQAVVYMSPVDPSEYAVDVWLE